jgi:hypothetical protein
MAVLRNTRVPRPWTKWVITLWSKILSTRGVGEAHANNIKKWQDGRLLRHLGGSCGLRRQLVILQKITYFAKKELFVKKTGTSPKHAVGTEG